MGIHFSKRRKNPLPAEVATFCLALSEALPEVLFKAALMVNAKYPLRLNPDISRDWLPLSVADERWLRW